MKILHYSDHVSPDFSMLYQKCEVMVSTGDLSIFDFFGLGEIKNKKPSFGVYGNHDSGNYMEKFGIVNLHNRVVEYNGLKWGGWQGCLRYKPGGVFFTENEAKVFYEAFPAVDILLLHAGPKGMLDDPRDTSHTGSEFIRQYVLDKRPKVVFLGHQYSDDQMQVGETCLYRTFGARIIENIKKY